MGGWGGVIAAGLAGAASGAGRGLYEDALEKEKIQAQKVRDEYLSAMRVNEHKQIAAIDTANIGVNADAKSAAAARNLDTDAKVKQKMVEAETEGKLVEGFVLSKGQTKFDKDGKEKAHVPNDPRVHTEEEKAAMEARTADIADRAADRKERTKILRDEADSRAEARKAKGGADEKIGKSDLKNFKDVTGEGGIKTGVQSDDTTGITRKWVGEETPVEGSSGILGFGKRDAVPGKPGYYVYRNQEGKEMTPSEVNARYPKIGDRAEPAQGEGVPPPAIKGASGRPEGGRSASGKIGSGSPSGIPSGSKPIGKSTDGRTVYQAPNGKRYVE